MKYNFELISEKSLLNCHCKGVHSFVLDEKNGMLTRMYITMPDHELWLTDLKLEERSPKSISFHPHRRDIIVNVIKGNLYNAYIKISKDGDGENIKSWNYISKIDGEGKFERGVEHVYKNLEIQCLQEGSIEYIKAEKIHTVWVKKGETVAWLIKEKEENKKYNGLCYSNANLEEFVWEGLYIKPTALETEKILTPYI